MTSEEIPLPQVQALIDALDSTKIALNGTRDELAEVKVELAAEQKRGKTMRRVLGIAVFGLVGDLVLTVPIAWAVVRADSASELAKANRANQYTTCLASNQARADVRELWNRVFSLTPSRQQSVEQQRRVAEFKAYVDETYKARPCPKP